MKKLKVGIRNKKLWTDFSRIISILCGIISFLVIFIDIPENLRIACGLSFGFILVCIFVVMLIRANCVNERVLIINQTKFIIKFGDLFEEPGLKTITFNEYFDTAVDDKLVSSNTINGKFLKRSDIDVNEIDQLIESDMNCRKNILAVNNDKILGKKKKYALGTCTKYKEYILMSFSRFDDDYRAFLHLDDYFSCLLKFWAEVNRIYNNQDVVLPLFGTGITRLNSGNPITCQKAMELIVRTFGYTNYSFSHECKITLVLSPKLKSEIDLYSFKY